MSVYLPMPGAEDEVCPLVSLTLVADVGGVNA